MSALILAISGLACFVIGYRYFFLRKKPILPLVLPFLFITAITLTALILKIQAFWGTNRPLAIISIILFMFVLWMVAEGCVAFKEGKRHQNF